jgi:hypothetical protein
MTYHKIKFFKEPSFSEIMEIRNLYYVIQDISAEGGYSIVLELSANGRINKTMYGI